MIVDILRDMREHLSATVKGVNSVVIGDTDFGANRYPIINILPVGDISMTTISSPTGVIVEFDVEVEIIGDKNSELKILSIYERLLQSMIAFRRERGNSFRPREDAGATMEYRDDNLYAISLGYIVNTIKKIGG